jgi:putative FmdB family regulatory protein
MPIYEYYCEKCGKFEFTQRITENPLGRCPTCKQKVRKLISNTSFQLKGTGWYLTDYARKGKTPEAEKASKANGKAAASSDGGEKASSEKKPAKEKSSESSASES